MAIPKIIHYVWVGKAPLPEDDLRYIEGWQKLNPDFKIKRSDFNFAPGSGTAMLGDDIKISIEIEAVAK